MGNPKRVFAAFIRHTLLGWAAGGGAAVLAPDFAANTLLTIAGGAGGIPIEYWTEIEKLRFVVGNADFAGAAGTLTFELRKNSAVGTALASLTITLAAALRGTVLDANVSAANNELAKLKPGDTLFLVRLATGTVFTAAEGQWVIRGRQMLQDRGA